MCVTWIWPVLLFQPNAADVLHCVLFTGHYNHETDREQASSSHCTAPEPPSVPPLTQHVSPHPGFGDLSESLCGTNWSPLLHSQLEECLGGLGVSHFNFFSALQEEGSIGLFVLCCGITGKIAFSVEDPGTYLLSPATQIRMTLVEEISDLELVSKRVYERSPVPLEGTQSPDLYTRLSPVLEQDLTRLWHPSPGPPANSTPARGGLQSQVTVFVGKKVEKDSGCQIYNQIFFL